MGNVETRAFTAGRKQAEVIIENVNLMYQNNTAKNFYLGLMSILIPEFKRRSLYEQFRKEKSSQNN